MPFSFLDPPSQDLDARVDALLDAHPCQPIVQDGRGARRFFGNAIIAVLLDHHPLSLRDLVAMEFPMDDLAQFVQLLGMECQAVADLGLLRAGLPSPQGNPCHPIQPLVADCNGRACYRDNTVVRYLLDTGPVTLNDLIVKDEATQPNWEQLAQLIGYSHDGAGNLQHMSGRVHEQAWLDWERRPARRAALRAQLLAQDLEEGMAQAVDADPGTAPRPRM